MVRRGEALAHGIEDRVDCVGLEGLGHCGTLQGEYVDVVAF